MTSMLSTRFRGFLPVIVDVETGGFDAAKDALLEIGAISIKMDDAGLLYPDKPYHYHLIPFEGANLDPAALAFNKIDPHHPFRFSVSEKDAFTEFFSEIEKECQEKQCSRAVMVAHNAWFDLEFMHAALARCKITKSPFHQFTSFDTATLGALAFGQTVLAKALAVAGIPFNPDEAHSAMYDAKATAELFCAIVNRWTSLGGWPLK